MPSHTTTTMCSAAAEAEARVSAEKAVVVQAHMQQSVANFKFNRGRIIAMASTCKDSGSEVKFGKWVAKRLSFKTFSLAPCFQHSRLWLALSEQGAYDKCCSRPVMIAPEFSAAPE